MLRGEERRVGGGGTQSWQIASTTDEDVKWNSRWVAEEEEEGGGGEGRDSSLDKWIISNIESIQEHLAASRSRSRGFIAD